MNLKKFWKEAKHVLTFVLAIALFFYGWANYDFSVFAENESQNLTVEVETVTYTGSDLLMDNSVKITVKDTEGNEITEYNASWTKDNISVNKIVDAGSYTVTVTETNTASGNTSPRTGIGNLTVVSKELTEDMVSLKDNFGVVNGEDHAEKIGVTVQDGEDTLSENKDYTLMIPETITTKGEYTITVTGKGNYQGTVEKKYTLDYAEDGTATIKGSTYQDEIYADLVEICPAEGYTISQSAEGEFAAKLTLTATPESYVVYLKNDKNGEITEYTLETFTIDGDAPTLTLIEPAGEWASSKEIGINASGADALYYSEENVMITSPITTLPNDLVEVTSNDKLTIAETIESEKTYYFYAIDKAGHVATASCTVNQIDAGLPAVTVSEDHANLDAGVYWKSTEDIQISVTLKDQESGIAAIEMTEGLTVPSFIIGEKEITTDLSVSSAGGYSVKVTDQAENEASAGFTVKQDTVAPEIELSKPEGEDRYQDSSNIYWFSDQGVKVPLQIADKAGTDEEKSAYTVVYSTNADMSASEVITVNNDQATVEIKLPESTDDATTYYFQAADKAGNKGTIQSVQMAYDNSAAEIRDAKLTQPGADEWINKAEFNGESYVAFSVIAEDEQTGIKKLEYSSDNGTTYHEVENYTAEGNVYGFVTNETYADGDGYQWKVRVTNHVERTTEKEISSGKIDTTAPVQKAYIKFLSDTVGANDLNRGTVTDNKWSSNIYEMASAAWNKIWGKNEIKFEVYVQDVTSGVADISMSYNGNDISGLKKVEGLKAFTEGAENASDATGGNSTGYTVFEGEIAYTGEDGLAIQNFEIDSITDVAGNTFDENVILDIAENTNIIYLDAVAPELTSVKIGDIDVRTDERYFYNAEQTVELTVKERFFGEEEPSVYPTVTLYSRESVDEKFAKTETTTNTWTQNTDGTWSATMQLPCVSEKEMEYQLVMDEYADPSGNPLTGIGVKEGIFTSKIYVIDALAPKLVNYRVNEPTECKVNDVSVYKNDPENSDMTVEFEIDDHALYYDISKSNLTVKVFRDTETSSVFELSEGDDRLKKSSDESFDGRSHKYSFTFDAEEASENEFHVEIAYQDAAWNDLTDAAAVCADGVYKSENYIIDHVAPTFNVKYSDAVNVVKDGEGNGKQPLSEHTAYYNDTINVELSIDEKYTNTVAENALEHFEIVLKKDGNEIDAPEIRWTHDGRKHTAEFVIAAESDHTTDGDYQFVVKYRDCAFNAMTAEDVDADYAKLMSLESDGTVGVYTSPMLVLDTTAPVVTTKYMNGETEAAPNQTTYGRDYFNDLNTVLRITVDDRNIRYGELKSVLNVMEAFNIDQTVIEDSKLEETIRAINEKQIQCVNGGKIAESNRWTLNLPLMTEANYEIPVNFTDLAGNAAVVNGNAGTFTEQVTTDSTIPEFELSYSIEDPANYLKWGYLFAKKKMTVTVSATDEIAGIQTIRFTIVDEHNKETIKTQTVKPIGRSTYSVDIPLKTEDFKGSIFAEVFDYSTNTDSQKRGHIVESTSKHSATGTAKITTITRPSRTVGGVDFYNTDVKFQLLLEDTYSGLGSWEYTGGATLKDSAAYKTDAGTDLTKVPSLEIVPRLDRTLTLDAQSNNKNDVLVKASFVDNVGHELSVEQKYNIDVTKPVITVDYDLNDPANGKYYKETRTATVKIKERNFDASDVEFLITSTDGPKPEISGWSKSGSGDDTVHTCTVAFEKDSDYTFTLKFMDMAGNVADYDRVDEFTIDKTIPVATVTYDNNSFLNEYYYDAARTATIDILEHNFDPNAMEIMVTADGSTAGVPHISAWASNGDHNIATITFSADAEYTFDIAGMDLALNEMADYTPDYFVVDQTAPELEIFDIEHMSANNGVVRPGIRYHDINYDQNGTVVLMTGYHNGVVEMTGDRKLEANGLELKLDDFAYVQEMDDIYTMEAAVYDLAGNSSEAMVMFSVNRFGSVYTFDEATDALIGDNGKYYTNKEQQLVITETNVDTLEFKEITLNLNGKLTTLKEGVDYTVALDGTDATWKQYTYTLKAENFVEEGTYILTIYSEDRATNTSDNNTKGKKIEFVVDKTNPSALISGVENGGQYRMHSKEVTIDIEDNVRLASVTVTIDGVETVYDAAQIHEMDGKLVLNIGSANHWQDIVVEVTDAAGNTEISEEMRVLVTANIFVQFFMNKPVFYGTLGGTALIAALIWWFLVGKKKKEEEQAK